MLRNPRDLQRQRGTLIFITKKVTKYPAAVPICPVQNHGTGLRIHRGRRVGVGGGFRESRDPSGAKPGRQTVSRAGQDAFLTAQSGIAPGATASTRWKGATGPWRNEALTQSSAASRRPPSGPAGSPRPATLRSVTRVTMGCVWKSNRFAGVCAGPLASFRLGEIIECGIPPLPSLQGGAGPACRTGVGWEHERQRRPTPACGHPSRAREGRSNMSPPSIACPIPLPLHHSLRERSPSPSELGEDFEVRDWPQRAGGGFWGRAISRGCLPRRHRCARRRTRCCRWCRN